MFSPPRGAHAPRRLTRIAARLAALAFAFAFAPGAVRAAPVRTPVGLVPAGGVVVLRLDWSAVRADPLLRSAVKSQELEKLFERVGVRGGEVSEAVVFLDFADLNHAGAAMILKGARLRPALDELRARGWGSRDYRGYRLHTEGSGDGCVAQLRSGFVVAGQRATVERVIAVESSVARSVASDVSFRRLLAHTSATAHPVSLLMILPQEYADAGDVMVLAASMLLDFAGLGPLGTLLDKVGLARGVGFSFGHRRGLMPVSLVALMRDERAAGLVSGTLTLLKGAASLIPVRGERESDRRTREAVEGMTVTRTRDAVSVRLSVPSRDLIR